MPADPQRLDASRLILPPQIASSRTSQPQNQNHELETNITPEIIPDRFGGWDGFDEDAPPPPDATPLPDVHLIWPLMQSEPLAQVEILEPSRITTPCPDCGGELTVAVKSWCLRCGYDSEQPRRRLVQSEKIGIRQAIVVLLFAALGCLTIVAATVYRREFVPDRTDLRIWWIGYELAGGFLLYWIGHAIAVALTIRHWPEPQPSCFDPMAVWRYALYRLPATRWAITYGLWGSTAFLCGLVLFCLNDFAVKDKTAKQKIHGNIVQSEPGASPTGSADDGQSSTNESATRSNGSTEQSPSASDIPSVSESPRLQFQSRKGTAVVLGYVPDPADPNKVARVVLGTRDVDGGLHFAGYAQLDPGIEGNQLRELARPTSTPGYKLSREVIPVEPKLLADIRYAEMDGNGVFKDTLILGVSTPKVKK